MSSHFPNQLAPEIGPEVARAASPMISLGGPSGATANLSARVVEGAVAPAKSMSGRVLVTLPVHNEAPVLRDSVDLVIRVLESARIDFTLSIAEDGSTDGTQDCIREIQRRHPTILVQSNPQKRGRGWALRTLWSGVEADFYAFSDTDFSASPTFLVKAIQMAQHGSAVVTGSRYMPGAHVNRPPLRRLVSKSYNQLIRLMFQDRVQDHQCGLKVFSRAAIQALLPLAHEDSWFWDTEILILANDTGLAVSELPVDWVERKARRTRLLRLASDIYLHGTGLLRLKSRHLSGRPIIPAPTRAGPKPNL
jgi:glycosyltransferase involved in cell wall biosynthesis